MIQSFQLQLKWLPCPTDELQLELRLPRHYIITGDEWFTARVVPGIICEETGAAISYPEHDLLWLSCSSDMTDRFKTLEDFEKEVSRLPRWDGTRYAAVEGPNNFDEDGRIVDYAVVLFDSRTGQRLLDTMTCEPFPGRKRAVARLRRGIEPMMRGERFSFM